MTVTGEPVALRARHCVLSLQSTWVRSAAQLKGLVPALGERQREPLGWSGSPGQAPRHTDGPRPPSAGRQRGSRADCPRAQRQGQGLCWRLTSGNQGVSVGLSRICRVTLHEGAAPQPELLWYSACSQEAGTGLVRGSEADGGPREPGTGEAEDRPGTNSQGPGQDYGTPGTRTPQPIPKDSLPGLGFQSRL